MQLWETFFRRSAASSALHRHQDLSGGALMKQDQMSMAASIESRVPFLDHVLVEFTARIPARYSDSGMAGKFILKAGRRRPSSGRSSLIARKWASLRPGPTGCRGRNWMKSSVCCWSRGARSAVYSSPSAVRRLFAEHRAKQRDHGNRIWRLLNLELWFRVCIEGEMPVKSLRTPDALISVSGNARTGISR